jgi:hypothetical protein
MSAKPWAEMTDREKCEALVAWGRRDNYDRIPCAETTEEECLICCMHPGDFCPTVAARLLKEGKV